MREDIERRISDPATASQALRDLKELVRACPTLANYQFAGRMRGHFSFQRRVRVAILTSYTSDFVLPLLEAELMLSNTAVEFYRPHYNQLRQEIMNGASSMYESQPDVVIAGFNLEDIFPEAIAGFALSDEAERRKFRREVLELYEGLAMNFQCHASGSARLLIQNLLPPFAAYDALVRRDSSLTALVESIDDELPALLKQYSNAYLLDYRRLAQESGMRSWTDPRTYFTARIPVASKHWIALAQWYGAYIRAAMHLETKCLVLDLDNTIWGGVLGEDGPEGIQIGDEYPGSVFRRFQEYLVSLFAEGYALAIASKNNVEDVLHVLRRHSGMVLREHHFAAIKANWVPKAENIRDIAREIRISFDHMLFIDDNPVEIANVQAAIPEVSCLQIASPPLDFVEQFRRQRCFGRLLITSEDLSRSRQYVEDRRRREFRDAVVSMDEFYQSLQQRLTIHINHRAHIGRIAQLTQRTNQFNMTTIRLTEAEVESLLSRPDMMMLTADLTDRFGSSGTIAYIQIRCGPTAWVIENWLMSCRVLGRTVEESLLSYIIERARRARVEMLIADYAPTTRNAPFGSFYEDHGFVAETVSGGAKRCTLCPDIANPKRGFTEVVEECFNKGSEKSLPTSPTILWSESPTIPAT